MHGAGTSVEFSLQPAGMAQLRVQLRRVGTRWVARASGASESLALGTTARQALTAALEPLGDRAARALLADLGLLEPSIAVIDMESADASA